MTGDEREQQSLVGHIYECLVAGLSNERAAQMTLDAFQGLPGDDTIGDAFVQLLRERWGFSDPQARVFRDWPSGQLRFMRASVIHAAELRLSGSDVRVRVSGLVGVPHSVTVSMSESNHMEITFVSPEMA